MHQCLLSTHSVSHLVSIWQKEKFIHLKLRITNDSIDSFKQYIIDNYHKSHEIFYNSTFFHIQLIGVAFHIQRNVITNSIWNVPIAAFPLWYVAVALQKYKLVQQSLQKGTLFSLGLYISIYCTEFSL